MLAAVWANSAQAADRIALKYPYVPPTCCLHSLPCLPSSPAACLEPAPVHVPANFRGTNAMQPRA